MAAVVLIAAILISSSINCFNIVKYISSPSYSFMTMAEDIKRHIKADGQANNILLGNFANSISLATGIFSINDRSGTEELSFKIEKYKPNYYVSIGAIEPEFMRVIKKYYQIELIKTYDVFDNYYTGKPVFFFKLNFAQKSG